MRLKPFASEPRSNCVRSRTDACILSAFRREANTWKSWWTCRQASQLFELSGLVCLSLVHLNVRKKDVDTYACEHGLNTLRNPSQCCMCFYEDLKQPFVRITIYEKRQRVSGFATYDKRSNKISMLWRRAAVTLCRRQSCETLFVPRKGELALTCCPCRFLHRSLNTQKNVNLSAD